MADPLREPAGEKDLLAWAREVTRYVNDRFSTDDIVVLIPGKGVVMPTPDNTKKYRVRIDNAGAVTSEEV